MAKNKKKKLFVYKHKKRGLYLQANIMGEDGDLELQLVKDIDGECIFDDQNPFTLDHILSAGSNEAELGEECIELAMDDFEIKEIEIIIKE